MDRAVVHAERHVADCIRRVAEQRGRVEQLERDGHEAGKARRLQTIFAAKLAAAIADWDRLAAELRGIGGRRRRRKAARRGRLMWIADDQD